jgi:ribosome biogenesis GTPase A
LWLFKDYYLIVVLAIQSRAAKLINIICILIKGFRYTIWRWNGMGILEKFRESKFSKMIKKVFGKSHAKIGIYGPPNVGKTTLANRILRDWTGDIMGSVSEVPHETRRAKWKNNIRINNGGSSLTMDLVDTPGIAKKSILKNS